MDATEQPKRPWWRKKRWRVAAAVWLLWLPLYAFSTGPVCYCRVRGWLPKQSHDAVLTYLAPVETPLEGKFYPCGSPGRLYEYQQWWAELAYRHRFGE